MQTNHSSDTMTVKITPNDRGNPAGKLADAELHFGGDSPLAGLKLIGFGIWERRGGNGRNVTFPARSYAVTGERRSFALHVDAQRLELVVERFPETVDIRLGAPVIRQEGHPDFRAHRAYEDQAAPASLGELRAGMVGDVQRRHRIEPQSRLKHLPIELQELARIWGAGIGDDQPDVDIVRSVGESRDESLL